MKLNKSGGEIPLCPYDSCRLLALNLYSYVVNPFTPNAYFDGTLFDKHVQIAQRLMDDMVDLEIEKLDAIIKKVENDPEEEEIKLVELNLWKKIRQTAIDGRRTGLGITAEGDMLAALNLIYGTEPAIEFAEYVHRELAISAYTSSITLAKERGSFLEWDLDKDYESDFIKRIVEVLGAETFETYSKTGRRNIALLTIAPTGTTSLMTQTTSGIEPVFLPMYKRRKKTSDVTKCTFKDEVGDMWEEYTVFHHKYLEWARINNVDPNLEENLIKSPYYKATSNDVDYPSKVKMQGKIQKWVDHSISVTVNMNKDVTVEEVSKVYEDAWKHGCKGITIYRDGSRSGVLVSVDTKKEEPFANRPVMLDAKVMHFINQGQPWVSFIGTKDNKPFEIFSGPRDIEIFPIPKHVTDGCIIKVKQEDGTSRYDFSYVDSYGYQNTLGGLSRIFDKEHWNYARLLSALLRNEVDVEWVIDTIDGMYSESESLHTWKNGVMRALKTFVPDGTISKESCSHCGGEVIYTGGCKQCTSCGDNKCS